MQRHSGRRVVVTTKTTTASKHGGGVSTTTVTVVSPISATTNNKIITGNKKEKLDTGGSSGAATASGAAAAAMHETLKVLPPLLTAGAVSTMLRGINPQTKKFIANLGLFFRHRAAIDGVYAGASNSGELEALSIDDLVVGIELPDGQGFKPEFRQQQVAGNGQPVDTLDALYESGKAVLPIFKEILEDAAEELGPGVTVKFPPPPYVLKGRGRAAKKAMDSYSKRVPGPAISWLFDIVRASLVCVSGSLIQEIVNRLVSDPRVLCVPKWKNRFAKPTPAGFRDVMLNLQLQATDGCVHTCELQIHLKAVKEFDAANDSHTVYEFWRDYFKGSMDTVAQRMVDLKTIVDSDSVTPGQQDQGGQGPNQVKKITMSSLVTDILKSGSTSRLNAFAELMYDYLCEYELAVCLYGACAHAYIHNFGPRCHEVADMCNKMALVEKHQHHFGNASDLFEFALSISAETKGWEHPDVGETYNNIAGVCHDNGEFDRALAFYEKSLAVKIKSFGEKDASVASTYVNMSSTMSAQGKFRETNSLLEKALGMMIDARGPKHQDVGVIYSQIGLLKMNLGDFLEGRDLLEKALAIQIRVFGPEHSAISFAYHNLALVHQELGDYKTALVVYEKSLNIKLCNEGPAHPTVATTYQNMANVYGDLADYPNSILMREKALAIYIATSGEDSEEAGGIYCGMADVYSSTGDLMKARPLYERSLRIAKVCSGDRHPHVGMTMANFGEFLKKIKDYDAAMTMLQGALSIFKDAFGPTHLYVGIMYSNIAAFQDDVLGEYAEALAMYNEAFAIKIDSLPPAHPDIGELHYNMACALENLEDYEQAMDKLKLALTIIGDALGDDHPKTKLIYSTTASVLGKQGKPMLAEEMQIKATAGASPTAP